MIESLTHIVYRMIAQVVHFVGAHLYFVTLLLALAYLAHRQAPERVCRAMAWGGLALLLWGQVQVLGAVARQTDERLKQRQNSPYTTVSAPAGGDTVQYAPSAAYEEIVTREQSLTFSDKMFQAVGLSALPGWNGYRTYSPESVREVNDRLERTAHATFVKRRIVHSIFHPIAFDDSLLSVKLDFVPNSVAYRADFQATYRFRNPSRERTLVRFTFPLPAQSGTLSDFKMTVNGEAAQTRWEGELEPGQTVEVVVGYRNFGRRSWTYSPTRRRESISNLRLALASSNSQLKFRRDSLFPTQEGSGKWTWSLRDVITSQDICVIFPTPSKRQTVIKLLRFSPLALLGFAALLGWLVPARPERLALATASYGGGLILTSYLCTDFTVFQATLLGGGLGAALVVSTLGRRSWPLALLSWLLPMAFAWPGMTGMAVTAGFMASVPLLRLSPS